MKNIRCGFLLSMAALCLSASTQAQDQKFADLGDFKSDRRLSAVPDLFTAGLITDYIGWKLGNGPRAQA